MSQDVSVPDARTFQSQDVSVLDLDDGKFSNHFSNFSYYDHN